MIKSFKHKGLQAFYEKETTKGIISRHAKKLKEQLAIIDTAIEIKDVDLPGYQLHRLKGNRRAIWSISVNGNWRITFSFEKGDAYTLDYEDYH